MLVKKRRSAQEHYMTTKLVSGLILMYYQNEYESYKYFKV